MPGRLETAPPVEGRRGVYLLTHPRSASNLFQTMMSKQPEYQNSGYKLLDAGFASLSQLEKGCLAEWPGRERTKLYDAFRSGFESLQDELENAQENVSYDLFSVQVRMKEGEGTTLVLRCVWLSYASVADYDGKQILLKEHVIFLSGPDKTFARVYGSDKVEPLVLYERDSPNSAHTNPTSMPDSLLLSMRPIFQIRHPILMFPSMVRAEKQALGHVRPRQPMLAVTLTLGPSRALYDWYRSHGHGVHPQVIDADDIIADKGAVRDVCIRTGLDPEAVVYEWDVREESDPMKAVFLSTISASKGIIPSLVARGLDFETEKAKWKAEFGDEDGEDLAKFVLDAMSDYNYLLSRRTYTEQLGN